MAEIKLSVEQLEFPSDCNVVVGQSHFIKTVEDLYEALVTSAPGLLFGIAFCEASGKCLLRTDGNDKELIEGAVNNALRINAGHVFVIILRNGYPINILNRIKEVQEVCHIYAATANPLQVVIAETQQGRGVMGVIDGFPIKEVENESDKAWRHDLLRNVIGYKR